MLTNVKAAGPNFTKLKWALTAVLCLVCVVPASMFTVRQFQEYRVVLADEARALSHLLEILASNNELRGSRLDERVSEYASAIFSPDVSVKVTTPGRVLYDRSLDIPLPKVSYDLKFTEGWIFLEGSIKHRVVPILTFISIALLTLGSGLFILHRRIAPGWYQTQAQERLQRERLSDIASVASDWFWELDSDLRLSLGNFPAIGSFGTGSFIGRSFWEISEINPKVDWERIERSMINREFVVFHYSFKVGEYEYWHELKGKPVFDSENRFKGYRGAGKDITLREQNHSKLERLAYEDELTGLKNLNGLMRYYGQGSSKFQTTYAVLIDLSGTRGVNSVFGVDVGNEYIAAAANLFNERLTNAGFGLTRLHTDKLLFLTHFAPELIEAHLSRIQGARVYCADNEMSVQFRAGASIFSDHVSLKSAIQLCELALLEAKQRSHFELVLGKEKLLESSAANSELLTAVDTALLQDQFYLVYQPKFDLQSEQPVSAEALIRWKQGDKEIYPDQFIPLLEQVNRIEEIDRWVVKAVCRQIRSWIDEGLKPLPVAINLSASFVENSDLAHYILGALSENKIPARFIEVELTEYESIRSTDKAIYQLNCLRDAGVNIAIDDYGTGHSNLHLLSVLPVDHLKIDRLFVMRSMETERDMAILSNVVNLGLSIGSKVIAEGIETVEQKELLKECGCNLAQGYLFSKPLLETKYRNLLQPLKPSDLMTARAR